jgi:DNA-binding transcriptional LysR family regulator
MSVSHAQFKAFHAVAIHGSFTGAAERLFLTQPAISDQVRKLEERFGVLLFHRNKRSVRLTDLGERLLGITQRLFGIEAEARRIAAGLARPAHRHPHPGGGCTRCTYCRRLRASASATLGSA